LRFSLQKRLAKSSRRPPVPECQQVRYGCTFDFFCRHTTGPVGKQADQQGHFKTQFSTLKKIKHKFLYKF
jgi:hypothetical protein